MIAALFTDNLNPEVAGLYVRFQCPEVPRVLEWVTINTTVYVVKEVHWAVTTDDDNWHVTVLVRKYNDR